LAAVLDVTHLFEEHGTLEDVSRLAAGGLLSHLPPTAEAVV
jgi:hypothetical protein